jgi:hypothetical protein
MSSSESSSKTGATFLWLLGSFAGFAVLFYVVNALFGGPSGSDPRSSDRLQIKSEIAAEQAALIEKMGLADDVKRAALFDKAALGLKAKPPVKSAALVPGSPTQLKQMAAEAPPAAAPGAVPATPASTPAPATPAPTAVPAVPAPAPTAVPPTPAPKNN